MCEKHNGVFIRLTRKTLPVRSVYGGGGGGTQETKYPLTHQKYSMQKPLQVVFRINDWLFLQEQIFCVTQGVIFGIHQKTLWSGGVASTHSAYSALSRPLAFTRGLMGACVCVLGGGGGRKQSMLSVQSKTVEAKSCKDLTPSTPQPVNFPG